ncbi:MAG TPA: T9SS type A sorting domain-containing protein [Bacteroidia bacterium]|nr:T9SS type A sorting domain-containing protein [Bacteroidia bacterium]
MIKNAIILYYKYVLFGLIVFTFHKTQSQIPNANLFNTASNAQGNGVLSYNTNDLNWFASNTGLPGSFVPAKVCGNQAPCCWPGSAAINNDWITYPHSCSSSIAEHSCSGNVDLYYKLSFNLPSANNCGLEISNPGAYCLALDLLVDNCLHQVYVNGNLVYTSNVSNPYGHFGFLNSQGVSLQLCNYWKAGTNNVIFHTKSGAPYFPGWSGFMAKVNPTLTTSNAPCSTMGINEVSHNEIATIFPNPTKDEIHIIGADKGSEIKVMNALGAVIYAGVANEENEKINLSQFNHGLYFVKLIQNGKPITTKIIKE